VSESVSGVLAIQDALAKLETAMDGLLTEPLDPATDDEIEDLLRRFETIRNKSAAVDNRLLQQVTQRTMPFNRGCKTTAVYLKYLLRLQPSEAARRVKAYDHDEKVEAELLEHAATLDPRELAKAGRYTLALLDPEGY
jgi:hypothetical protein